MCLLLEKAHTDTCTPPALLFHIRKCVYPGVLAFYNELDRGQVERCERALQALSSKESPDSAAAARAQNALHVTKELHRHAPAPVTVPRPSSGSCSQGASPTARGPSVHWAATAMERTATPTSDDSAPASPIWPSRSERSAHFERLASSGFGDPWSQSTSLDEDEGPERGALRRQGSVTSARLCDARAHDACHQLSQRMGLAWAGWNASGSQWGVNLVFLSARPESYKGFTEADSYKRIFAPLRVPGGLPYMPVLLLGDLSSAPRVRWWCGRDEEACIVFFGGAQCGTWLSC